MLIMTFKMLRCKKSNIGVTHICSEPGNWVSEGSSLCPAHLSTGMGGGGSSSGGKAAVVQEDAAYQQTCSKPSSEGIT